jgi:uncharacterized protein (TIGR01777 family)
MRVFVTGATGFIGRALVPRLQRDDHVVVGWVRSPGRARGQLGADVELVPAEAARGELIAALERCDAVVNLAGEPLMDGRWTAARRAALETSRIRFTEQLVDAMAQARPCPAVLISGSAVGYYGDRNDERLIEASTSGDDFLARLCRRWESAAAEAGSLGARVVLLRTGVALGRDGGALAQMLPPFRFGAGGPFGSGAQYLPWIHLHDLVGIIARALVDTRYSGPVNGVAPEQTTSRAFASALGRVLHRPSMIRVPAIALEAALGNASTVLLASQRVEPMALRNLGFAFRFPTLDSALEDILGGTAVAISPVGPGDRIPEEARYELRTSTVIDAPLEQTFDFFSKAANLGVLTPAAMRFSIDGEVPPMEAGAVIDYRVRIARVPVRWRTRIERWEPERGFVDVQEKGPYRFWRHEHTFRADGPRTVMEDRVWYAPPLGIVGRLVNRLFIEATLRRIFQYRDEVIRLRFGVVDP